MTRLSLRLLGGFRADLMSGRPVVVRRKKAQALLAYLARRPGVAHARESLASLLWPGTTDDHARHNLRQTLFALRHASGLDPLPFDLESATIALHAHAVDVDVTALERGAQSGVRETLRDATALYQGDFLAGFTINEGPFDDWVSVERQRLRRVALDALEKLLAMDVAAGAIEQAVETAARMLALDPLHEAAHRALMDLYARQGRRTLALRQYQLCVDALRQQLGVGPEAATTRRYREILGQSSANPSAAAATVPTTRYTRSGDVDVAYQVVGEGATDLLLIPGWVSNVECFWEEPRVAQFLRRLASIGRLILFDKRGTGLSDRVAVEALPTLEQRMEDVRAVMDAARSERATLIGYSEGGTMSALFAATYPERTAGLVMIGSYARWMWSADHPWGRALEEYPRHIAKIRRDWGGAIGIEQRAPSAMHDPSFVAWWARFLRQSASPGAAIALTEMNRDIDVRHVLPAIRVPTLVLHAVGDRVIDVGCGRYMASRIPNARYVELPGSDHLPWLEDGDAILGEIEGFIAASETTGEPDRLLVTVIAAELMPTAPANDDRYHELARLEIVRYRGRLLEAADQVVVAAFDGPARAIRCAIAIVDAAARMGLTARVGAHTGECEVRAAGLTGIALDVARRIAGIAKDGEVVVSTTVKDLVAGSGIEFVERGAPGATGPLFVVLGRDALSRARGPIRGCDRRATAATVGSSRRAPWRS